MPLDDGYGFIRGTLTDYFPDTPESQGEYFHIHTRVDVGGTEYHGAIDVDSKKSDVGVEWRVVDIKASELQTVLSKGVGYFDLASNDTSGAIDYIRSPMFAARLGCLALLMSLFKRPYDPAKTWSAGTNVEAYAVLKPLLQANLGRTNGLLVFGEPFTSGNGLHNIHQNQGDPPNGWYAANGTWQDGCVFMEQSASRWKVFMNKFSTQAFVTDANGNPLP